MTLNPLRINYLFVTYSGKLFTYEGLEFLTLVLMIGKR
jgi:hypothetical protein